MPSSGRNSSRILSRATESAPPETATATRSPGWSRRWRRMYWRTWSITTIKSYLVSRRLIVALATRGLGFATAPNYVYTLPLLSYILGVAAHLGGIFMKVKMVKWGNSLAVRIPKPAVDKARLKEGDSLEVESTSEGQIELRRVNQVPTLRELVAQLTPAHRSGQLYTGAYQRK